MLTLLTIRNFKRLGEAKIELGHPVIFVGPNNSGKTSALQALSLWEMGVKQWLDKRGAKKPPGKRPGVTINRKDLFAVPVAEANDLWRERHVRNVQRINGKQRTNNVRIDIIVEGITRDRHWTCGMEFDLANAEAVFCRPLRIKTKTGFDRMSVPEEVADVQVAFLPPMSGLLANENRLDRGAIDVRIGEGRTAEVLRNLCHVVAEEHPIQWTEITQTIEKLFGSELLPPKYVTARGEITMSYVERGVTLDISCSGRGLQQTLLLLAYMYANPGSTLLFDEPDAHHEILRQRQIYDVLTAVARKHGNQIIAATHSEVLLNEAAGRDMVVAFVGEPHRIDDRVSQVRKALKDIGFDQYYQAEQTGWILYLEGSTDLAILQALAETLEHEEAKAALERPFVNYVGTLAAKVRDHFYGLKEAVSNLRGVAIFDRLENGPPDNLGAKGHSWQRREIENYICDRDTLLAYAESSAQVQDSLGPIFTAAESEKRIKAMEEAISEVERALTDLGKESPWGEDLKVSDEFLEPVFKKFFKKLSLPNIMAKKNFYELAYFTSRERLAPEIAEVLDLIAEVATPQPQ